MKRFAIVPILLLALVLSVWAAWTATEDFAGCTGGGADLNGCSSGTGWSGNWTKVTGSFTVNTQSPMTGNTAGTNTNSSQYYRDLTTAISAGTITFKVQTNSAALDSPVDLILRESSTLRMIFQMNQDGNFKIWNGATSTYDTISAWSANTVYTVTIDFDDAAQPNQYRIKIDAGSYTAWKDVDGSTYSTISRLEFNTDSSPPLTHSVFFDDIQAAPVTSFPSYYYRMMSNP